MFTTRSRGAEPSASSTAGLCANREGSRALSSTCTQQGVCRRPTRSPLHPPTCTRRVNVKTVAMRQLAAEPPKNARRSGLGRKNSRKFLGSRSSSSRAFRLLGSSSAGASRVGSEVVERSLGEREAKGRLHKRCAGSSTCGPHVGRAMAAGPLIWAPRGSEPCHAFHCKQGSSWGWTWAQS
jgi:hypothetical protein